MQDITWHHRDTKLSLRSCLHGAKCYLGKVKPQEALCANLLPRDRWRWNLKTMQVGGYLTWVAWVGCASVAGAPCNSFVSYSSAICLALSLPAVLLWNPFLSTPPPLRGTLYGCGKYWLVSIPLNNLLWRCLVVAAHRVVMDTSFLYIWVIDQAWGQDG